MTARSLTYMFAILVALIISLPASAADLIFENNQRVAFTVISPETYLNYETDTKVTAQGTCIYISLDFPCDQLDSSSLNPGDLVRLNGLLQTNNSVLDGNGGSILRAIAAPGADLSAATSSLLVIDVNQDLTPTTGARTVSFGPPLTLELITPLPPSAILFLTTLAGFITLKTRQRSA